MKCFEEDYRLFLETEIIRTDGNVYVDACQPDQDVLVLDPSGTYKAKAGMIKRRVDREGRRNFGTYLCRRSLGQRCTVI